MQWFKHDATAAADARIKKIIYRWGPDGYAIYFHCLELIAGTTSRKKITFELEHDAEIIADNLKVKADENYTAIDKVNRIMRDLIQLQLLQESAGRVYCLKMALRLDDSTAKSAEAKRITEMIKAGETPEMYNPDQLEFVPEPVFPKNSEKFRLEEKRKEEKRSEEKKKPAAKQPDPAVIPDILNFPGFVKAWHEFVNHRNEIKKHSKDFFTTRAQELNLKKCEADPEDAIEMIEIAIMNNWRAVFPLKKQFNSSKMGAKSKDEGKFTEIWEMVRADIVTNPPGKTKLPENIKKIVNKFGWSKLRSMNEFTETKYRKSFFFILEKSADIL